jgi:hypothetical protein
MKIVLCGGHISTRPKAPLRVQLRTAAGQMLPPPLPQRPAEVLQLEARHRVPMSVLETARERLQKHIDFMH